MIDPGLLDYMARHTGSCRFVLQDPPDPVAAVAGMRAAARAISHLAHPEETECPLASFVSGVEVTPDGITFWVDMADAETYDGLIEQVLDAVVAGLAGTGVRGGILTHGPVQHSTPAGSPGAERPATPALPALGVPVPEPHQQLFVSSSGGRANAGYFLPHDPAELMRFYEDLPGVVLSFESHQPEEGSHGMVVLALADAAVMVLVHDAGHARNVEITVHHDPVEAQRFLDNLLAQPLPGGVILRVDRRR